MNPFAKIHRILGLDWIELATLFQIPREKIYIVASNPWRN